MMKLVRDRIPAIIKNDGKTPIIHVVKNKDRHHVWLQDKMIEEMNEFYDDPSYEEAADVYEVFRSLIKLYEMDIEKIIEEAERKRHERGGFDDGILLERVDK
jgi:predicted house-cleaning noncanonical NTP pyrophosphatase (MazG superfamily)